jgi:hypothetical protein
MYRHIRRLYGLKKNETISVILMHTSKITTYSYTSMQKSKMETTISMSNNVANMTTTTCVPKITPIIQTSDYTADEKMVIKIDTEVDNNRESIASAIIEEVISDAIKPTSYETAEAKPQSTKEETLEAKPEPDTYLDYSSELEHSTIQLQEIIPIEVPVVELQKFTKTELDNYTRQSTKCKFKTPQEEYDWAKTQPKVCSKCQVTKTLVDFRGNTSGTDAFDRDGYRLRRPECTVCTKSVSKGKNEAKKKAKELGIPYVAPEGTVCAVCNKPPSKGNCLVFDHCHELNVFRGYCCNSCNRSMGILGDNVQGLLNAVNYLLKTEKNKIVQNEDGILTII